MDSTSNIFARRARMSTTGIASAIAVTVAAVASVLYSAGHHASDVAKVEGPIHSAN